MKIPARTQVDRIMPPSWETDSAGRPSREQVERRLVDLTTEIAKIPRQRIVKGATFKGDLRMESIAFVEIHVAMEDEYDIELDPLQVIELNEFGAIVDYVHRQILQARALG